LWNVSDAFSSSSAAASVAHRAHDGSVVTGYWRRASNSTISATSSPTQPFSTA
jgi:hypothetical protein